MVNITQKHRLVAVKTPLGEDVLVFGRMKANEELGRLFDFQLELFSERTDIQLSEVLGKPMTVRLDLPKPLSPSQRANAPGDRAITADTRMESRQESSQGGGTRYFNGFVTRFSYVGMRGQRYGIYHATLSPWLWFLTRTADCRIFQNKTVPEIIKSIFSEHGFTDFFKPKLSGSYRQWEYCVQYRETDFNFVSRLMEQEGMYYYFTHEDDKHILVLADDYSSHGKFPGYDQIPFFPPDIHDHRERDHLFEWLMVQQVLPGAYTLNDFDFKVPRKSLRAVLSMPKSHARANGEIYDYPGSYTEPGDGNTYSRIRLEELLAQHETMQGRGNAAGLGVGYLFNLTNCPRDDQNREYLIVSAVHEVESDDYETIAGTGTAGKLYQGQLTAIDAKQPYRAPRITPKPVVQGPQTAIVVGKGGEEIWTDQYGRVKVQFHWDREGNNDENSSCWVRVSHPWAGKNWGAVAIPRIGQEVIVDFLEGDPDQPIITGRVYNGASMPPYGLPAGAVVSGIKSNSTKGGGGYNEMSMDDTKGKEKITIHGQYDMNTTVEHDETLTVNNNRTKAIKVDENITVGGKKNETITGKETNVINGGREETVTGTEKITINGNRDETVTAGEKITITGGRTENVTGAENVTIAGATTYTITGATNHNITGPFSITASTSITLTVGASKITMLPGSIEIKSPAITVIGASITSSADGAHKISGGQVNVSGGSINSSASGTHEIAGGVVKIN